MGLDQYIVWKVNYDDGCTNYHKRRFSVVLQLVRIILSENVSIAASVCVFVSREKCVCMCSYGV